MPYWVTMGAASITVLAATQIRPAAAAAPGRSQARAHRRRAGLLAVYRSRFDRALYARERWAVLMRDRRDIYWRARRLLKQRVLETLPVGRSAQLEREGIAA